MTAKGVARLAVYLAGTVTLGVAIIVRDAIADIGHGVHKAWNAPREGRSVDDLLAGYEAHAWPHKDTTARDNVRWG
jgi:hypothetical protein